MALKIHIKNALNQGNNGGDPLKRPLLRLYSHAILLSLTVLVIVGVLAISRFAAWKYWLGPIADREFEDIDRGVFFHHFSHRLIELAFTIVPFIVAILMLKKNNDPAKRARFAMHVQFQLTVCIVTLAMVLIGNVFYRRTLFSPLQLFWANIVLGLGSLIAYANERFESKEDNELLKLRFMLRASIGHAIYQIAILVLLLLFADKFIPGILSARDPVYSRLPTRHITLLYTAFELMSLFNMFNCRMIGAHRNIFKGLFANRLFLFIWLGLFLMHLIGLLLLFFILPSVYGQESLIRFFFFSKPLGLVQWLICLAFGISVLAWGQVVLCFVKKPKGEKM